MRMAANFTFACQWQLYSLRKPVYWRRPLSKELTNVESSMLLRESLRELNAYSYNLQSTSDRPRSFAS